MPRLCFDGPAGLVCGGPHGGLELPRIELEAAVPSTARPGSPAAPARQFTHPSPWRPPQQSPASLQTAAWPRGREAPRSAGPGPCPRALGQGPGQGPRRRRPAVPTRAPWPAAAARSLAAAPPGQRPAPGCQLRPSGGRETAGWQPGRGPPCGLQPAQPACQPPRQGQGQAPGSQQGPPRAAHGAGAGGPDRAWARGCRGSQQDFHGRRAERGAAGRCAEAAAARPRALLLPRCRARPLPLGPRRLPAQPARGAPQCPSSLAPSPLRSRTASAQAREVMARQRHLLPERPETGTRNGIAARPRSVQRRHGLPGPDAVCQAQRPGAPLVVLPCLVCGALPSRWWRQHLHPPLPGAAHLHTGSGCCRPSKDTC